MSETTMAAPLHGVRVLDLTRLLPGPMCTLYLADLGADVVKVEDTGAGDYARTLGPPGTKAAGGMSAWYRAINRNKRSLAIDLKADAGRDAFVGLAARADVVVEGFRPGVAGALRIGYDALRERNPRLVYCSISGYGQTGPRAREAGHDVNYIGYAGMLAASGERGGRPVLANFQVADLLGGAASAAIAILGALFGAARTGAGRFVDVAMADAVLAHQVLALGRLEDAGTLAARGDDLLTGGVPCYGVYETRDGGFLAVGALEPKFWALLCRTLGRDDLAPFGLATGAEGDRVRDALAAIFRTRTRAAWQATFASVDCCVSPVLSLAEALADPQFAARAMLRTDAHGLRQFAPPFAFAPPLAMPLREAPRHGEQSRDVLREAGYDDRAIDALVRSGVVKDAAS